MLSNELQQNRYSQMSLPPGPKHCTWSVITSC